jgi:hypothetical protein
MTAPRDAAAAYFLQRALRRAVALSWQPARVTAVLAHFAGLPWATQAVPSWVIGALPSVASVLSGVGAC